MKTHNKKICSLWLLAIYIILTTWEKHPQTCIGVVFLGLQHCNGNYEKSVQAKDFNLYLFYSKYLVSVTKCKIKPLIAGKLGKDGLLTNKICFFFSYLNF